MRVYVTRYALTKGIIEADLEDRVHYLYGRIIPKMRACDVSREEAFEKLEDAKIKAEEMRKKRRQSLEKQIEKLDSLRF